MCVINDHDSGGGIWSFVLLIQLPCQAQSTYNTLTSAEVFLLLG